jgi:hypothetical protein
MGRQPASFAGKSPTGLAREVMRLFAAVLAAMLGVWPVQNAVSGELETLQARKDLTPEQLIRTFADFKYELSDRLQDAETFLTRKRGDCDDFATLAASLLSQRGYTTKIVAVMMAGETHVVCYVREAGGILDFNHRANADPILKSDGTLEDIAEKTAAYFRNKWHMASEIRYEGRRPVYVDNTFPLARPVARVKPVSPAEDSQVVASEESGTRPAEKVDKVSPSAASAALN